MARQRSGLYWEQENFSSFPEHVVTEMRSALASAILVAKMLSDQLQKLTLGGDDGTIIADDPRRSVKSNRRSRKGSFQRPI